MKPSFGSPVFPFLSLPRLDSPPSPNPPPPALTLALRFSPAIITTRERRPLEAERPEDEDGARGNCGIEVCKSLVDLILWVRNHATFQNDIRDISYKIATGVHRSFTK